MIDFQFLRDCVTALKVVKAPQFGMTRYVWGMMGDGPCGTPACVIGHYMAWTENWNPTEKTSFSKAGDRYEKANEFIFPELYDKVSGLRFGLTKFQREELFGGEGCDNAKTPQEAIAYIEKFILEHGGFLENPRPLDVCLVPDWEKIAQSEETFEHVHG